MLRGILGTGGSAPVGGSGSPGTIPVWNTGTTLTDSLLSQSGGNAVRLNGITFFAGKSGSGTGGNYRITDDSGTDKWLMGLLGTAGARAWTLYDIVNAQTRVAVDGTSGNVGIGTASPVASAKLTLGGAANSSIRLSYQTGGTTEVAFDQMNSATGEFRHSSGVSVGWGGFHTFYTDTTEKVRIGASSMDASLVTGYGLKLPATPGNTDPNTIDAYAEGTWSPTTSGLTNCSGVTLTNTRFTVKGREVTIEGTAQFTVTAATTGTGFYLTLPATRPRGSSANTGCGGAVDNTTGYPGSLWNGGANTTDVLLYFYSTNPFGAGSTRSVPFTYVYFTATA